MEKKDFIEGLVKENSTDILQYMIAEEIPLIIWGNGSMAASIRKLLRKEGVRISACWVDNCEKEEYIDDIPIMSIDDIHDKYGIINVVMGHSKYELIDEISKKYPFVKQWFCLVNVCYGQWKGINRGFVDSHINEYVDTVNLLEDDQSKECLLAYLNCRISGDYKYIVPCCKQKISYFNNPFFELSDKEAYLDVGAYNGDTIKEFIIASQKKYSHIYAVEPEDKSIEDLRRYVEKEILKNVTLYNFGCWNEKAVLEFSEEDESSSISSSGKIKLEVQKLDEVLKGKEITLIKINFLKGVVESIEGASEILRLQKPNLVVTVGFDEWGIITIPQLIKKINPKYRISLRYAAAMPARLILFAY